MICTECKQEVDAIYLHGHCRLCPDCAKKVIPWPMQPVSGNAFLLVIVIVGTLVAAGCAIAAGLLQG